MRFRPLLAVVAAALALGLASCGTLPKVFGQDETENPIEVAQTLDQKALATYELYRITLEAAASLTEDPRTPDAAVNAIAGAAEVAYPAVEAIREAGLGYLGARLEYETARDSGAGNLEALIDALASEGANVAAALQRAKPYVADLTKAIDEVG